MSIEASKDPEINKIRFRASNYMFQNSDCVFLEYNDCIQVPWLIFLDFFIRNEKMDEFFNCEEYRYLSLQALLYYYIERKHVNPLIDLIKDTSKVDVNKLDGFLEDQISSNDVFFNKKITTVIDPMIKNLINTGIAKKIIIWYPNDIKYIRDDISSRFLSRTEFAYGNIEDVIRELPQETTYFFSDVTNVLKLEELNKLDYSALMLPGTFRYNYMDDTKDKYVINMDYLNEKYTFKWAKYYIF